MQKQARSASSNIRSVPPHVIRDIVAAIYQLDLATAESGKGTAVSHEILERLVKWARIESLMEIGDEDGAA